MTAYQLQLWPVVVLPNTALAAVMHQGAKERDPATCQLLHGHILTGGHGQAARAQPSVDLRPQPWQRHHLQCVGDCVGCQQRRVCWPSQLHGSSSPRWNGQLPRMSCMLALRASRAANRLVKAGQRRWLLRRTVHRAFTEMVPHGQTPTPHHTPEHPALAGLCAGSAGCRAQTTSGATSGRTAAL